MTRRVIPLFLSFILWLSDTSAQDAGALLSAFTNNLDSAFPDARQSFCLEQRFQDPIAQSPSVQRFHSFHGKKQGSFVLQEIALWQEKAIHEAVKPSKISPDMAIRLLNSIPNTTDHVFTAFHAKMNEFKGDQGDSDGVPARQFLTPIFPPEGKRFCLGERPQPECEPFARYRTIDGWCNNLRIPFWGASDTAQIRVTPYRYDDGISKPRTLSVVVRRDPFGNPFRPQLPNPRLISTSLNRGEDRPHKALTLLVVHFGQFVDHDFVDTPISVIRDQNGNTRPPQCCNIAENCRNEACFPFDIPRDDPFYSQFGLTCMEFVRSQPSPRPDCQTNQREQQNHNTHFVDASQVYGSDDREAHEIRLFTRGRMNISTSPMLAGTGVKLLPENFLTTDCRRLDFFRPCFRAGDARVNVQPGLTSMHTIFLREHNRIAEFLSSQRLEMPDEVIYQEARRIVIAQYQNIVYGEFLNVLLGPRVVGDERNKIKLTSQGFAFGEGGYNENVNPATWIETSTAAYRLHTLLQDFLPLPDSTGKNRAFREFFFSPHDLYDNRTDFSTLDLLIEGLLREKPQRFDQQTTLEMTNRLFQGKNEPFGLDIFALSIQRGRDHGLATYNDVREFCGLHRARTFAELQPVVNAASASALERLYLHPDDVDFLVGGLSETPVAGGVVGPTFACILTGQFRDWKVGDRFWFENPGQFQFDQLQEIKKTSLAGIICANSNIKTIQRNVFRAENNRTNPRVDCSNIPQIDLNRFVRTF